MGRVVGRSPRSRFRDLLVVLILPDSPEEVRVFLPIREVGPLRAVADHHGPEVASDSHERFHCVRAGRTCTHHSQSYTCPHSPVRCPLSKHVTDSDIFKQNDSASMCQCTGGWWLSKCFTFQNNGISWLRLHLMDTSWCPKSANGFAKVRKASA